jgi:hypothetical protein
MQLESPCFYPVLRNDSTIGVRDADHAGTNELTSPMVAAVAMHTTANSGVIDIALVNPIAPGACRAPLMSSMANKHPMVPPMAEITTDSPRMIPKIDPRVNPSVFKTPISRTRSRTDIEMVFADTSSMVNVMAAQKMARYTFRFPRNDTNASTNACSVSVKVGAGEFAKS